MGRGGTSVRRVPWRPGSIAPLRGVIVLVAIASAGCGSCVDDGQTPSPAPHSHGGTTGKIPPGSPPVFQPPLFATPGRVPAFGFIEPPESGTDASSSTTPDTPE